MSHARLGVTALVLVLVLVAGGAFAASQSEAMADEPITIVAMEGTADYVPDTPVELALEEVLGVKLRALPLHVHEEEKIIATFSGGDVPDMFTRYTASLLIDNGFTRQISEEMIREHMPNYSAIVDEFGGESAWRKWRDPETGMLNAVPVITMGSTTRFSMGVRGDWLAKLGLEVPATIDDFGQMLAAFVNLDPDGNGKNDTHGLTGQPGWPTVLQWPTIFGAYGVLPGGSCFPGCGRWIDEGGEVVWSDASAGYRQALEALAQAYAAGLIDPEWATQTEEAAGAKVAEGLVGAWDWHTGAFMAGSSGAPARAMQKNPDATWEVIWDGLTGPDGHHGTFAFSETPVSGWARMIGAHVDDAKLAKILQINEMLWTDIDVFTLSYCGIEGETYTIAEDGRCEFLVEKPGAHGMTIYAGGQAYPTWDHILLVAGQAAMDNGSMSTRAHLMRNVVDPSGLDAEAEASDSGFDKAEVGRIAQEYYFKAIRGDVDIAATWDAYVQSMMDSGLDTITTLANARDRIATNP